MPDQEQELDLLIVLEVVRYLRLRQENTTPNPSTPSLLADIVKSLPPGVSIGSLLSSEVHNVQEVVMGDHYQTGQAGAVGPYSTAIGQSFTQVWNQASGQINLEDLANELGKVRDEARSSASGAPEEDLALAELANAEVAAKQGDGPTALGHLARAGQWALGIAQAISVPVAIKALETAMGG
jgi:hypothetical protein